MNRRKFLASAAAIAASRAAASSAPLPSTTGIEVPGSRRPNLIFIFADQLRYGSCGYAGDEYAQTPNMDRLASQGCNLHQAIASTPVCAPYRASLMTGKYQSSTGMIINEIRLSPDHVCFGHALTRAQYQTAYIGKWHLWANQLGHHELIRNGFTPPGPYRLGFDGLWEAYNFNHFYYHSPYFNNDVTPHIRQQYEPDQQTDRAIEYIRGAASKSDPFALFLSWGPPHSPWGPGNVHPDWAERFRETKIPRPPNFSLNSDPYADSWQKLPPNFDAEVDDEVRAYYAQTANLDWNLGRLMKTLEEQGIADNSILVFTSDHGEMFGSQWTSRQVNFLRGGCPYPLSDPLACQDQAAHRLRCPSGHTGHHAHAPVDAQHPCASHRGGNRPQRLCPFRRIHPHIASPSTRHGSHRGLGRRLRVARSTRSRVHLRHLSPRREGTPLQPSSGPLPDA